LEISYLARHWTRSTFLAIMTRFLTSVITSSEASTTDFCAFSVSKIWPHECARQVATTTRSRTAVATRQVNSTCGRTAKSGRINISPALCLYDMTTNRDLFQDQNFAFDLADILRQVARNSIFRMTARQLHVVHLHHAQPAIFATSGFLTTMPTRTMQPLTSLRTWKDLMHTLRMTPRHASMPTSGQHLFTGQLASSFWTQSRKVFWLLDFDRCIWMTRTAEA
jgi:hypothetical protein